MTYAWNEDRTKYMLQAWEQGLSASQIAMRLFETYGEPLTRNSVIGKLMRNNAPRRMDPSSGTTKLVERIKETRKKRGKRTTRTSPIIPKTSKHKPINVTPETVQALHTPLAELTVWNCRAVASTEQWGKPTYCGHAVTHEGASYCAEHAARFYVTIEKKPRRLGASGVNRRADYRDSARWGAR